MEVWKLWQGDQTSRNPDWPSWKIFDVYADGCTTTSTQEPSTQQIADVRPLGKCFRVWLVMPVCSGMVDLSFTSVGHRRRQVGSLRRAGSVMSCLSALTSYPAVDATLPPHHGGGLRETGITSDRQERFMLRGKLGARCNSNFVFGCYVTAGDWTERPFEVAEETRSGKSLASLGHRVHYFSALTFFTQHKAEPIRSPPPIIL